MSFCESGLFFSAIFLAFTIGDFSHADSTTTVCGLRTYSSAIQGKAFPTPAEQTAAGVSQNAAWNEQRDVRAGDRSLGAAYVAQSFGNDRAADYDTAVAQGDENAAAGAAIVSLGADAFAGIDKLFQSHGAAHYTEVYNNIKEAVALKKSQPGVSTKDLEHTLSLINGNRGADGKPYKFTLPQLGTATLQAVKSGSLCGIPDKNGAPQLLVTDDFRKAVIAKLVKPDPIPAAVSTADSPAVAGDDRKAVPNTDITVASSAEPMTSSDPSGTAASAN